MKWTRRDIIKGLGGLPIAGAIWWAGAASSVQSNKERTKLLEQLNIEPSLSKVLPPIGGAPIRVGIIGFGIRGEQLCRSLGFATKDWLDNMEKAAKEKDKKKAEEILDRADAQVERMEKKTQIEREKANKAQERAKEKEKK